MHLLSLHCSRSRGYIGDLEVSGGPWRSLEPSTMAGLHARPPRFRGTQGTLAILGPRGNSSGPIRKQRKFPDFKVRRSSGAIIWTEFDCTTYYLLPYLRLPTIYYQVSTTYFILPTSFYVLPTTYNLLPTTYYLPPTTYYPIFYLRPSLSG